MKQQWRPGTKRPGTWESWDGHLVTVLRWSDPWNSTKAAVSASHPIKLLVWNQKWRPRYRDDLFSVFWAKQSRVLKVGKKRKTEKFRVSVFLGVTSKHQGGQRVQLKNKSTGCRQKLDDLWCCSSVQRQPALRRCRRPTFWGDWAALIWFGWNGSNSAPTWCPPGLKILSLFFFFCRY